MACCAFAITLLTQLLAPIRVLLQCLGYTPATAPDASVVWAPDAAPIASEQAVRRHGQIFLALIALDLALFAIFRLTGAGDLIPRVASPGSNAARVEALIHRSICGQSSRRTL